ncbi:MBL fold metallo-hydrolase [Desulfosudis oleivorans]|nr:MBL fold metallo-hydrolase [Desulfosudis oleivorans]
MTQHPRMLRIADHLYLVRAPAKGRFPFCHGFLFCGGGQTLMIDAGLGPELTQEIDRLCRIDILVISHSHPDHILNWHLLEDRTLLLPRQTPDSVTDLDRLGVRYTGTPERGAHWVNAIGRPLGLRPFRKPDGRFDNGHIFALGPARIEAIHAPGHLDDHYCFFDHGSGTLITTDIDFSGFGPWYGNPEGAIKPFQESIRRLMELPYRRVCASHRLPHEGDATQLFEGFLDGFERQKQTVFALLGKEGKTLEEMVAHSPFYKNRFPDRIIQHTFEEQMIAKLLALLEEEGRVIQDHGRFMPAA